MRVTPSIAQQIIEMAKQAGFDASGLAGVGSGIPNDEALHGARFEHWIGAGRAGEMEYLKRRDEQGSLLRASVQTALPWARSVLVCAVNYNAEGPRSTDPAPRDAGWIARYAWSGAGSQPTDYHDVVLARLRELESTLHLAFGDFQSRCYVDTGPIVERHLAQRAGIGWTAKNTCVINQHLGSWLFLGVVVLGLPFDDTAQMPAAADRCGSCTRCLEACPTGALDQPYQMDATRCISYLTIEKRGEIPEALRSGIGRQVFGCDICQDVCPWNNRAPVGSWPDLSPRPELINPSLGALAALSADDFRRLFRSSPVSRTKLRGVRRNVAIAMGNSGDGAYIPQLKEWAAQQEDPVLQETAAWGLRQLGAAPAEASERALATSRPQRADRRAKKAVEPPNVQFAAWAGAGPGPPHGK